MSLPLVSVVRRGVFRIPPYKVTFFADCNRVPTARDKFATLFHVSIWVGGGRLGFVLFPIASFVFFLKYKCRTHTNSHDANPDGGGISAGAKNSVALRHTCEELLVQNSLLTKRPPKERVGEALKRRLVTSKCLDQGACKNS